MAHHNDQVGMLGRFYCEFNMRSNLPFKVKSTAAWVGIQAAFLFYIAEIKKQAKKAFPDKESFLYVFQTETKQPDACRCYTDKNMPFRETKRRKILNFNNVFRILPFSPNDIFYQAAFRKKSVLTILSDFPYVFSQITDIMEKTEVYYEGKYKQNSAGAVLWRSAAFTY
ncbi:MAG: hypothetical protein II977_07375 [Oscillospiraceae bacterium]|nr:hypothetical protein [Oscillospiraceae bacterium]